MYRERERESTSSTKPRRLPPLPLLRNSLCVHPPCLQEKPFPTFQSRFLRHHHRRHHHYLSNQNANLYWTSERFTLCLSKRLDAQALGDTFMVLHCTMFWKRRRKIDVSLATLQLFVTAYILLLPYGDVFAFSFSPLTFPSDICLRARCVSAEPFRRVRDIAHVSLYVYPHLFLLLCCDAPIDTLADNPRIPDYPTNVIPCSLPDFFFRFFLLNTEQFTSPSSWSSLCCPLPYSALTSATLLLLHGYIYIYIVGKKIYNYQSILETR